MSFDAVAAPRGRRRLALAVLAAAVLGALTLGSLAAALLAARAEVRQMDEAALSSSADVAEQRLLTYIGAAEVVSQDLARALANGEVPFDELAVHLLERLGTHDNVRAVSATYPDGRFVIARRSDDGFITRAVDPGADPTQTFTTYDTTMGVVSVSHEVVDLPVLAASSYLVALKDDGVQWTEPELRTVTKRPGVWASVAARDDKQELVAVVSADIFVEQLGPDLGELSLVPSGEAFVLGGDRTVIASAPDHWEVTSQYAEEYGLVAPAAALGVYTTNSAEPRSAGDVFGTAGDLLTLERGLGDDGPPWVLHVEAPRAHISPAAGAIARSLVVPLAVGGAALIAVWFAVFLLRSEFASIRKGRRTDSASGLYSTTGFDKVVERRVRRMADSERAWCAVVLDVAGLDHLATARGDFAVESAYRAVGEIIQLETRDGDIAERSGDSEFVVVISLREEGDAAGAAERIRAHVAAALSLRFGFIEGLVVTAGVAVAGQPRATARSVVDEARATLAGSAPRGRKPGSRGRAAVPPEEAL